jgi:N-acetylglucosaminyldiphosphoundecaprenol N-acetyl-beta-D-mannosaminyltransferase
MSISVEQQTISNAVSRSIKRSVMPSRPGAGVVGTFIDAVAWSDTVGDMVRWGARRESRVVAMCNVHSVVTARSDDDLRSALSSADRAMPDGQPIAWVLRRKGFEGQQRVNGPDLMWSYLSEAERQGRIVFFYGSTQAILDKLGSTLAITFPRLRVGGMLSPPFRDLTAQEDTEVLRQIHDSRAEVVFVALGCPKQEKWMAAHRGRLNAVMVGVGAAFAYHAGVVRRAPFWMQRSGLEWLYRLLQEPRRLWKRYVTTNTLFILALLAGE